MVDRLFNLCVYILQQLAFMMGVSYKELNIWIFVVIHPLITGTLFTMCLYLWHNNTKLKHKQLKPHENDNHCFY